MSVIIISGEREIWSGPSLSVDVFLQEVSILERIVGCPSGIGPIVNDEVSIAADQFAVFVVGSSILVERIQFSPMARALLEGVLGTVFTLASRLDLPELESSAARLLRERARAWMI
jgi:hypothetical protein